MSDINNMAPNDIVISATIIAIQLCKGKNQNEINVLGNFITLIGTIMLTILSQQQALQAQFNSNDGNGGN